MFDQNDCDLYFEDKRDEEDDTWESVDLDLDEVDIEEDLDEVGIQEAC